MTRRTIVMLGPAMDSRGGIASVAALYRARGLFAKWAIDYIPTTLDGSPGRKLLLFFRAVAVVAGRLLRGRVAALHLHTASRRSFWRKSVFACLGFLFRTPVLLHIHGGAFLEFLQKDCGPLSRRFACWVLSHASSLIVLSETWRRELQTIQSLPCIVVVPNPVLCEGAGGPAARPIDETRILYLGRIERAKGIDDLLDACAALAATDCRVTLLCAGTGELRQAQETAARLALQSSITWLGWVDGEAKQALLREATLFALPSYHEGLPMALLEAMAAGLPVVATAVGGIPDVVTHGVQGLLVRPGDIAGLADAIRAIATQPAIGRRMGREGRAAVIERFRCEAVFARLEALYQSTGLRPRCETHL